MSIHLTKLDSVTSILPALDRISVIFNQPSLLTQRILAINEILIDLLNADAIWFFTTNILPTCSIGLIRTPLRIAPQAQITVIDDAPPKRSAS